MSKELKVLKQKVKLAECIHYCCIKKDEYRCYNYLGRLLSEISYCDNFISVKENPND